MMMNKKYPAKKNTTWTPKRYRKCYLCVNKEKKISYKDVDVLRNYISERGKILHRRITKNCAKHQRFLTLLVKQARNIALLPYTVE